MRALLLFLMVPAMALTVWGISWLGLWVGEQPWWVAVLIVLLCLAIARVFDLRERLQSPRESDRE